MLCDNCKKPETNSRDVKKMRIVDGRNQNLFANIGPTDDMLEKGDDLFLCHPCAETYFGKID